jgi:hypothetical protein
LNWTLGFGFWSLDFGLWSLAFGISILVFGFFNFLHLSKDYSYLSTIKTGFSY